MIIINFHQKYRKIHEKLEEKMIFSELKYSEYEETFVDIFPIFEIGMKRKK
jgi:hypothetical protein